MIRDLVIYPDARLGARCKPVADVDAVSGLVRDLFDTMYDAYGRGLAAPQIGQMARVFVMDAAWKTGDPEPMALINPVIIARDAGLDTGAEGCLSIPGLEIQVTRPQAVTVQWQSETGEFHMNDFDGFEARCIQHELDHLNGVLTLDHLENADRAAVLVGYPA